MNNEENMENVDFEDDEQILILVDEDNNEHEFVIIDAIYVDEQPYVVLEPNTEDDLEDGAVVFKLIENDGEEMLYEIEDEDEWERVATYWNELVDAEEEE